MGETRPIPKMTEEAELTVHLGFESAELGYLSLPRIIVILLIECKNSETFEIAPLGT